MLNGFMLPGGVDTSDMTATAADILDGKTFLNAEGDDDIGTMPNRGQYQWAGGVGFGTENGVDYIAFNNIPEGAYFKNGEDSAPEIRADKTSVVNAVASSLTFTGSLYSYARGGRNNGGQLNLHANATSSVTISGLPYQYCKVDSGTVTASISDGTLTISQSVAPDALAWVEVGAYDEREISKTVSYSVTVYN